MVTRSATAGESVNLRTARGRNFTTDVLPSCGSNAGHWACSTHPAVHIANNIGMSGHVDSPGAHLEVWVCHEHGPEQP